MTSISPFGARPHNTPLTGTGQQPARGAGADKAGAARVTDTGKVALSSSALDMQERVAGLGNATVDLAQDLLGSFAGHLFGDAMKGATIDFDSASLESSSTFAAGTRQAQGTGGVTNAAAFSLTDSAHFAGKGTITLADGQKYDFEVEVQYEASLSAGAATSATGPAGQDTGALPTVAFPDIEWPGGLNDLFKLMDKPMSADIRQDGGAGDKLGTLSARLFRLVHSAQSSDTYGPPTTAHVRKAANAYAAGQADAPAPVKAGPAPTEVETPIKGGPTRAPAPVKDGPTQAPAPDPVVDTQTLPVRSGGDIPLTISTTPPADDAA